MRDREHYGVSHSASYGRMHDACVPLRGWPSIVSRPISPFPVRLPPDHLLANVASPNRLVANPPPTACSRSPAPASRTQTRRPPCRPPRPPSNTSRIPRPPSRTPPRSPRSSFTHHTATTRVFASPGTARSSVRDQGLQGSSRTTPVQRHPNPPGPTPPSSPRRGGPGAVRTGSSAGIEFPRAGLL